MSGQQMGRLAMRQEGESWNAYYAMPDTMDGAIFLGSIRLAAVINNPDRKQAFMDMMRGVVSDVLEEQTGAAPDWGGAVTAPLHEKAGNA